MSRALATLHPNHYGTAHGHHHYGASAGVAALSARRHAGVAAHETLVEDKSHAKKYAKGKLLGKGGFAKCYEMRELETGKVYAGKCITKTSLAKGRAKQKLSNEIRIHRAMNHAHIVKFHQCFEDREHVYIILEICENKSLVEMVKRRRRLSEPEAIYFTKQIVEAMSYMVSRNIIHRDLKLGNFFLGSKMDVKIGDFGLATQLDHAHQRKTTICGTPNYIAPEMLDGGKAGHSFEVDIWSLGVIIYTMVVGKPPFETDDVKTTYKRIRANHYSFPDTVSVSSQFKAIVRSCLHLDPSRRPSIKQIEKHPWLAASGVPRSLPTSALLSAPSHATLAALAARGASSVSASASAAAAGDKENTAALANHNHRIITASSKAANSNNMPIKPTPPPTSSGSRPVMSITSGSTATVSAATTSAAATGVRPLASTALSGANLPVVAGDKVLEPLRKTKQVAAAPIERPASAKVLDSARAVALDKDSPEVQVAGNPLRHHDQLDDDDRGGLTNIHRRLTMSFQQIDSPTKEPASKGVPELAADPAPTAAPASGSGRGSGEIATPGVLWLTKWVDYSNKYGLGYQLSNGAIGVFFNDFTKVVTVPETESFQYIPYSKKDKAAAIPERREAHTLSEYPQTLQKKVTLLKYFKNYLIEHKSPTIANMPKTEQAVPGDDLVYVKKWLRTRHAIIFRLSNKNVQVNFFDHTKIILSSEAQIVTYVNKEREFRTYSLAAVMKDPAPDLINRMRYTKDILHHLISKYR